MRLLYNLVFLIFEDNVLQGISELKTVPNAWVHTFNCDTFHSQAAHTFLIIAILT